MIRTPHVDWLALSPPLSLLGAAGLLLMVAVFVPRRVKSPVAALVGFAGFVTAFVFAVVVDAKTSHGTTLIHDSMFRDRWSALAQVLIAGSGAVAVLLSVGERWSEERGLTDKHYIVPGGGGLGEVMNNSFV